MGIGRLKLCKCKIGTLVPKVNKVTGSLFWTAVTISAKLNHLFRSVISVLIVSLVLKYQ